MGEGGGRHLARHYLRGHVVYCAQAAGQEALVVADDLRVAPVRNLYGYLPLLHGDEHVVGLEVAVNDLAQVQEADGGQYLRHYLHRVCLAVAPRLVARVVLHDAVEKVAAVGHLHHKVEVVLRAVEVKQADDILVAHLRPHLDLVLALNRRRLGGHLLDGHRRAALHVHRLVHFAVRALVQDAPEAVPEGSGVTQYRNMVVELGVERVHYLSLIHI